MVLSLLLLFKSCSDVPRISSIEVIYKYGMTFTTGTLNKYLDQNCLCIQFDVETYTNPNHYCIRFYIEFIGVFAVFVLNAKSECDMI